MITRNGDKIEIILPEKFTEKHIGSFAHNFYNYFRSNSSFAYSFDFTKAEWIANQNLLLLSAIIKYLYNSEKKLQIKLLDFQNLNKRKVEQVCELWYIWEFSSIFNKKQYDFANYIETFSNNTLENLCEKFEINFEKYTNKHYYSLYEDQFSVIPFVPLNYINNAVYENTMNAQLKPVYALNEVINNGCSSHITQLICDNISQKIHSKILPICSTFLSPSG